MAVADFPHGKCREIESADSRHSALSIFDKSKQPAGARVYITSKKLLGAVVVSEKRWFINIPQERFRI